MRQKKTVRVWFSPQKRSQKMSVQKERQQEKKDLRLIPSMIYKKIHL